MGKERTAREAARRAAGVGQETSMRDTGQGAHCPTSAKDPAAPCFPGTCISVGFLISISAHGGQEPACETPSRVPHSPTVKTTDGE